MPNSLLTLVLSACMAVACLDAPSAAAPLDLTLFGWSDQHVQTNGNGDHLAAAVDGMNALPGVAYPPGVRGKVSVPALVLGLGDITEWPTHAALATYEQQVARLRWKSFEIAGNHDEGGLEPSTTVTEWIRKRHGGLSYAIDRPGIRILMVHTRFDPRGEPSQPVDEAALEWIRTQLAGVPRGACAVVCMHPCLDSITNRDALVDVLETGPVVLVLGGHYHKSVAARYRGIPFVQLPSPAPNGEREVMVVRITNDRVWAMPWNYSRNEWVAIPAKTLDAPRRDKANKP